MLKKMKKSLRREHSSVKEETMNVSQTKSRAKYTSKNIPISESYSDLKYLSSLCLTNFNGVFQSPEGSFREYQNKLRKDGSDSKKDTKSMYGQYSTYYSNNNTSKLKASKKNLNVSASTKASFDEMIYNPRLSGSVTNLVQMYSTNQPEYQYELSSKPKTKRAKKKSLNHSCEFVGTFSPNPNCMLGRSSSLKTIQDFKIALEDIQHNYINKLRSKVEKRNKFSKNLDGSVKKLSNHIRCASQELNKTKETSISMNSETVKASYNLKRLLFENRATGEDISKMRKECEEIQEKINSLDQERIMMTNEYDTITEDIRDNKKKIKTIPQTIKRIEEDRKNLKTAILIVHKKIEEIRTEITKMDNVKDYLGLDLEAIMNYYKNGAEELETA